MSFTFIPPALPCPLSGEGAAAPSDGHAHETIQWSAVGSLQSGEPDAWALGPGKVQGAYGHHQ